MPISFLAAIALSLSVFNDQNAYAQNIQNTSNTSKSTLYVVGNAQTTVKLDTVSLSLSVETINTATNKALTANSKAMNNALGA